MLTLTEARRYVQHIPSPIGRLFVLNKMYELTDSTLHQVVQMRVAVHKAVRTGSALQLTTVDRCCDTGKPCINTYTYYPGFTAQAVFADIEHFYAMADAPQAHYIAVLEA